MPPSTRPDLRFPAGVRAFRPGDESAILAAMFGSLDRGEMQGVSRHFLEDSVERLADEPWICAVAEDAGRVAGWVTVYRDDLTVDLPFRRRGHGTRLVEAGRLVAGREGLALFRAYVPPLAGSRAFAAAAGLRYHSSLWKLRLDPDAPVEPPSFRDDVVVRWIEPGRDEDAFAELVNTTFLDHPSPLRVDAAFLRSVHARRGFDPSTILLVARASDPDGLVGFCRVGTYHDDDGVLAGEVKLVGVRREQRGRGLGRELVRWGIEAVHERGAGRVYLSVEGENTGALRLYVALGFRAEVEWPHWVAPAIQPGEAATPR